MIVFFEKHPVYCHLLREIIENSVHQRVIEVNTEVELLKTIKSTPPKILLMNVDMVLSDSFFHEILFHYNRVNFHANVEMTFLDELVHAKQDAKKLVIIAIEHLKLTPSVCKSEPVEPSILTRTENMVLKMLADGNSYKMIASELDMSFETVKTHLKNIYKKIGANNAASAVRFAITHKII